MRPVLRYHGGKWKLAKWILSHFPDHRIYTEAFGGAASVLMQKRRSYSEVYNDLDGEIVNLFRVLRDPEDSARLIGLLALTPFARKEFELSYQLSEDQVEQARRTVFRSFAGFCSAAATGSPTGFRANSNRSGNTPAHDWENYPCSLKQSVERMRGVVIEHRPAAEVIEAHDSEDCLHYADPPYPHSTRTYKKRPTGQTYRHEMQDDDHRAIAKVLRAAKGMVVVSGYPCDLYDQELFPDWTRVTRNAHADCALDRVEVLWLNHAAVSRGNGRLAL